MRFAGGIPPETRQRTENAHADMHDTHWHVQRTPSTNNPTCTYDSTSGTPRRALGTNTGEIAKRTTVRGGVTQDPIASCGISVVRSGISCHVAGERPSRRLSTRLRHHHVLIDRQRRRTPRMSWPIQVAVTFFGSYVIDGAAWSAGSRGTRGTGGRWVVPRLCGAGLVPSDGSAVAAAKHSSATRRWVVRNSTWLAISKMLFDDEIALKWGVAYYYN